MRLLLPLASCTIAVAVSSSPALARQMVEAPLYSSWARVPVGTKITLRTVTESGGQKVEALTSQTLLSVDEKQAVVEQTFLGSDAKGTSQEGTQLIRHRRWFPLPSGKSKEDIGKPSDAIASGEETIELAGRTFEASWYDASGQTEAGPSMTRTWIADDVPGRLLKAVTTVEATNTVVTIELVEVTTP
ncbi:hypothetical protein [Tautonia sociabilis]|uniref:DUF3108 domain-containing protein n=1 Tax=Tautonia sociabilis TaxID=2080755 RepID=A0A432MNG3_9BACT|nr:hypothetical protein [Tautonia sociabilis]RUL88789.1 hypothetical protein TsocGM_05380 [Tautonia sociabilis]